MLHDSTFEYLKPNQAGIDHMAKARTATRDYATALQEILPEGPDKAYILRTVREVGMWANVAITRDADGTPRPEHTEV